MTAAETAFLNEIIGARITEYLEMVLSDPKSLSGLVFAGGTSRWPGLTAIAQEFAGCPCRTISQQFQLPVIARHHAGGIARIALR